MNEPIRFIDHYIEVICTSMAQEHARNYDWRRFGKEPLRINQLIRLCFRNVLRLAGLMTLRAAQNIVSKGMGFITPHLNELEWLYSRLIDRESRELLVTLMAYRAIGRERIKLPLNTPEYWAAIEEMEKRMDKSDSLDLGFMGMRAWRMDMTPFGHAIKLYTSPTGAITQFKAGQYRCAGDDTLIDVRPGDVVLDAGGCMGDTALYFANKCGPSGRVYSFEFMPLNLKNFKINLGLNPALASRIQIVEKPVWEHSGDKLYIHGNGPATRLLSEPATPEAIEITTCSIDDFMEHDKLSAVDFIKMDIEGAELHALKGAENTLRTYKPKLAISVYHHLEDFWTIPMYLDQLGLGYRFYLRHYTIHHEETILYACR